ncbi:MAG: hypothetical protein LVS60_10425 [Nodosilinea sp. LVE1205-7]
MDSFNSQSLKINKASRRSLFNAVMTGLAGLCILTAIVPLVLVLFYVTVNGFNRLDLALFTQLPPAPGLQGRHCQRHRWYPDGGGDRHFDCRPHRRPLRHLAGGVWRR